MAGSPCARSTAGPALEGELYVTNKDNGVVQILNSVSFEPVGAVDFKTKANNIRYDAKRKLIYVGYGYGAIGIINVVDDWRGADIPLANFPKQFRLEATGYTIFVDVPAARHLAVIDCAQNECIAAWAVTEEKENVPMVLDEKARRLLIGCNPGRFIVFNTETGKSVASLSIHLEADGIAYDQRRHRMYVSCGAGVIESIREVDADHYELMESIPTKHGAGTCLFAPELDRLFLAVPQGKDRPAQIRVYRPSSTVN